MKKPVVVIGGGIVGLSTCFEFQDAGHEVTLIDPEPISGATHHAGGMLAPIAEVQFRQPELVPLMKESARIYPDLIARVSRYTDLPTGYRTEGTLVVGADRADARHIADLVDYLEREDLPVDVLSTRQARALEPALSPRIAKAIGIPGDHQLQPRLYARAVLDAVRARGARIIQDTVVALEGASPCTQVTLSSGSLDTAGSIVVLAAGLGAAKIPGWYAGANPLQLRPVYGDMVWVRMPAGMDCLVSKVVRGFVENRPVYIIPRNDGTVTIGATSREDQPHSSTGGIHDLLRDAIRLVPGLEETEFVEATCGARPGTPDDLPYLGWAGSNLVVSTGYFRHGILLSALAARTAVDLVTGRELAQGLEACDPFRHAPATAHSTPSTA